MRKSPVQLSLPISTFCVEASHDHARISPARERARALLANARACGLSLPGSSENCGPSGSLSKTSPAAPTVGSMLSASSWAGSVMQRFRSLCRHSMSGLRTSAGESSLLATPTETANQLSPSMAKWPGCKAIQDLLPTPTASSYGSNKGGAAGRVGKERHSLGSLVKMGRLPTPMARDYQGPTGYARKSAALPDALGQTTRCLSPRFVEWVMGFPPSWVADVETTNSKP